MRLLHWLVKVWKSVAPTVAAWFPALGVVLLGLAGCFAAHSWSYARQHVRAEAVVTENVSTFAAEGGVVYAPKLRFRAADGATVTLIAGPGEDDPAFQPGTVVPVLYPAGQPQQASVATAWRLYHWAIVFAIWGVVVFDLGWVVRKLGVR